MDGTPSEVAVYFGKGLVVRWEKGSLSCEASIFPVLTCFVILPWWVGTGIYSPYTGHQQ